MVNLTLLLTSSLIFVMHQIVGKEVPSEFNYNPYKFFENKQQDWRVVQISEESDNLFYTRHFYRYMDFKAKRDIVSIDKSFNEAQSYQAKLQSWLLYYLTNNYNPHYYE